MVDMDGVKWRHLLSIHLVGEDTHFAYDEGWER